MIVVDEESHAPLLVLTTAVDTFVCDSIDHARGVYRIASVGKQCIVNTQRQDDANAQYEQALKQKDEAIAKQKREVAIRDTMIRSRDYLLTMKDSVVAKAIGVITVQDREMKTAKAFGWGGVGLAIAVALLTVFLK